MSATLDATGSVTRSTFDDGDLYGFVDAHSHLLTNFGFGGGGIFHGAPFHRLGVEAALPEDTGRGTRRSAVASTRRAALVTSRSVVGSAMYRLPWSSAVWAWTMATSG